MIFRSDQIEAMVWLTVRREASEATAAITAI